MSQGKLASSTARGYGVRHRRIRADYQRHMDAGQAFACSKCGRVVDPSSWDLAHVPGDKSRYLGPQHVECNRDTVDERRSRRKSVTAKRWKL